MRIAHGAALALLFAAPGCRPDTAHNHPVLPPDSSRLRMDQSHLVVEGDSAAPSDVVREYYAAITAHDFARAYSLWGNDGAASGKSLHDFAAGFARTARVSVETGAPGRVEGAAGSRYVDVPVVINAVTSDGARQRFTGTYTLRRFVVDGSTSAQRRWHIHSARITQTR